MEMYEFERLMALAANMNGAKNIFYHMREMDLVDISCPDCGVHLQINHRDPLYPRLKKLLDDFIAEAEEEIERIEIEPKEEK